MKIDDDNKLKAANAASMCLMFVKIFMACFPFIVVPQKCSNNNDDDSNDVCSNYDKIVFWHVGVIFNAITFFTFCNLYFIQSKREFFMIDKFDEDDEIAEDALNEQIKLFPDIHNDILSLNKKIKNSNTICLYSFVLNTIGSTISILFKTYLDTTTITVLLTNSMLVNGKLTQIRKVYNCDDLAMSSVTTKQRVYNIIDRDISGIKKDIEMQDNLQVVSEQDIATTIMQLDDV